MISPISSIRSTSFLKPSLAINLSSKSTLLAVPNCDSRSLLSVRSKSDQEWIPDLDPEEEEQQRWKPKPRRVAGGEENKFLKRRIRNVEMRRNNWKLNRIVKLSNGTVCEEQWSWTTNSVIPPFTTPPLPKAGSETVTDTVKRIVSEEAIKACWSFMVVVTIHLLMNRLADKYKGVAAVGVIVMILRDRKWPWSQTDSDV